MVTSWTTIGFQLGLRTIEQAYRSSKDAFERDLAKTEAEWRRMASVPADEETDDVEYYRDHLTDDAFDAEQGSRLMREAFALAAYHYWEKEMCLHLSITGKDAKSHANIIEVVVKDGRIEPDRAGLDRLRLIANTIKHGLGQPLYDKAPALFADEARHLEKDDRHGWHALLRLRDADVQAGFAAVRASGPGQKWRDSGPDFEDDEIE